MNQLATAFNRIAAQVARQNRMPFKDFMEGWGLEALLADAEENDYDLIQMVTQAIWRLCLTNGKLNQFHVGRLTI
jgi:hypothetical protein